MLYFILQIMNDFRIHLYPVYPGKGPWPTLWPEAEKCGVWPGSTLFTENTRKKKEMIVLMPCYHKEPIATGSVIKHCNFLMK